MKMTRNMSSTARLITLTLLVVVVSVSYVLSHGQFVIPRPIVQTDFQAGIGARDECALLNTMRDDLIADARQYAEDVIFGIPIKLRFQITNHDGAGDLKISVDSAGHGLAFGEIVDIKKNIPGKNGFMENPVENPLPRSFEMHVEIRHDLPCTGPKGTCIIRAMNKFMFASCAVIRPIARFSAERGLYQLNMPVIENPFDAPAYPYSASVFFAITSWVQRYGAKMPGKVSFSGSSSTTNQMTSDMQSMGGSSAQFGQGNMASNGGFSMNGMRMINGVRQVGSVPSGVGYVSTHNFTSSRTISIQSPVARAPQTARRVIAPIAEKTRRY